MGKNLKDLGEGEKNIRTYLNLNVILNNKKYNKKYHLRKAFLPLGSSVVTGDVERDLDTVTDSNPSGGYIGISEALCCSSDTQFLSSAVDSRS
jgi:hypothetical protein